MAAETSVPRIFLSAAIAAAFEGAAAKPARADPARARGAAEAEPPRARVVLDGAAASGRRFTISDTLLWRPEEAPRAGVRKPTSESA